jgi:hypothetical protein
VERYLTGQIKRPRPELAAKLAGRFIAEDPYVVEVRDGTGTQIVVFVPLDMGEEWMAESRERLAAARAALGVDAEDHPGPRP